MSEVETVIALKLKELEPTLDVHGADRKVLQVLTQDFASYLRYLAYIDEHGICLGFTPLDRLLKEEPQQINEYLTVWVGSWLKKWKQRFALSINQNTCQPQRNAEEASKTNELSVNLQCKQEMIEMIVFALIKNSEICGTRLIAEDILTQESKKLQTVSQNAQKQQLMILNSSLLKVREISQRTGHVVLIKIAKEYYTNIES